MDVHYFNKNNMDIIKFTIKKRRNEKEEEKNTKKVNLSREEKVLSIQAVQCFVILARFEIWWFLYMYTCVPCLKYWGDLYFGMCRRGLVYGWQ